MQRRTALKQLGVMVGGAMLLPSCLGKETTAASIKLNKLVITSQQENLLGIMVEALIPKTDTPGARELNAHHYVLHMIDDCFEPETQKKFMLGFEQAQHAIKENKGKDFKDCTLEEQQVFFKEVAAGKIIPALKEGEENALENFFTPLKQLTVRGYTGSEYVMTNIYGYTMIPGRFDGVVEINSKSDLKTMLG